MSRFLSSPAFLAAGRVLNALFFIATSVYSILTFSPFAYEQFIVPHLVSWVANFVVLHADFYWLALCVTTLTLAPYLKASRALWLAWAYLIAGAAFGLWLLSHQILPGGTSPSHSLAIALAALVPPICLAVFD